MEELREGEGGMGEQVAGDEDLQQLLQILRAVKTGKDSALGFKRTLDLEATVENPSQKEWRQLLDIMPELAPMTPPQRSQAVYLAFDETLMYQCESMMGGREAVWALLQEGVNGVRANSYGERFVDFMTMVLQARDEQRRDWDSWNWVDHELIRGTRRRGTWLREY